MKWFKHENTYNNPKIEMLTDKHGIVGYGVYFRTLELIASAIDESNQDEWGYLPAIYTSQYLAKKLQVSEEDLENILATCYELKLLELQEGNVFCQKVLERCDDYTQRLLNQSKKKVGTKSEESPTKNRIEEDKNKKENRLEKNINIANAIEAKPLIGFGDKDINEGIELMKKDIGAVPKSQLNRYALNRLYKSRTKEKTLKVWEFAQRHKDKPYCPSINSFMELEEKWASLENFANRQVTQKVDNNKHAFYQEAKS